MGFSLGDLIPAIAKAVKTYEATKNNPQFAAGVFAGNNPIDQGLQTAGTAVATAATPLAPLGTANLKGQINPITNAPYTGNTPQDYVAMGKQALGSLDPAMAGLTGEMPTIADATTGVKMAANDTKAAATDAINETKANLAIQPGGLEAGGIKIPGKNSTNSNFDSSQSMPQLPTNIPLNKKMAMKANSLENIQFPGDVYGAKKEAQVRNVLNDEVPGQSPEQKYKNLEPAMQKQQTVIQQEIDANPKTIPASEIDTAITQRAQKLVTSGKLTQEQAADLIKEYRDNLYRPIVQSRHNLNDPQDAIGLNELTPNYYSGADVYKMKQEANKLNSDALEDRVNGNNLTPQQQLHLAGRDALDDVITKNYPKVKEATLKESALYNAAPVLGKLRNQSYGVTIGLPAKVGPIPLGIDYNGPGSGAMRNTVATAFNNPGKSALIGTGIISGGGILATQIPKIANNLTNAPTNATKNTENNITNNNINNQSHSGYITPQNSTNVKPDGVHYSLPQVSSDPTYMTYQDFLNQAGNNPDTRQYKEALAKYNNSKDLATNAMGGYYGSASKMEAMNNIINMNYVGGGNALRDELQTLPPGFWNNAKQYKTWSQYFQSSKQQEASDIDTYNSEFATAYQQVTGSNPPQNLQINLGDSINQANTKWDAMQSFLTKTYNAYINPYLVLTSATGAQTDQGKPQPASYPTQPANGSGDITNTQYLNQPIPQFDPNVAKSILSTQMPAIR